MNGNQILAAMAAAGISAAGAMAQDAVQWRVQDGGNGHWYSVYQDSVPSDWASIRQVASSRGAQLVTLASAGEAMFVYSNVGSVWIGLHAAAGTSAFVWSTGEPVVFTNWGAASCPSGPYPNNPLVQSRFVYMNHTDCMGQAGIMPAWDDYQPSELGASVERVGLEWSADCNGDGIVDYGQCRDGSLPDFNGNNIPDCCEQGVSCVVSDYPIQWRTQDGGNGHWYQLRPKVGDWFACRAVAQALSGDLASPSTQAENSLVERIVPPKQFPIWNRVFLGGRQSPNSTPNEGWYWVDGSDWTYTDWYINQPDGGEPFLVAMPDENGCTWGDYPSNSSDIYYFIIEWSADCNGDGFVDYGQILAGQLQDSNGNGIPDECELPCLADIDGNGEVNGIDLAIILDKWGTDGGKDYPNADIDGDGTVAGPDLSQVLSGWGPCQ